MLSFPDRNARMHLKHENSSSHQCFCWKSSFKSYGEQVLSVEFKSCIFEMNTDLVSMMKVACLMNVKSNMIQIRIPINPKESSMHCIPKPLLMKLPYK